LGHVADSRWNQRRLTWVSAAYAPEEPVRHRAAAGQDGSDDRSSESVLRTASTAIAGADKSSVAGQGNKALLLLDAYGFDDPPTMALETMQYISEDGGIISKPHALDDPVLPEDNQSPTAWRGDDDEARSDLQPREDLSEGARSPGMHAARYFDKSDDRTAMDRIRTGSMYEPEELVPLAAASHEVQNSDEGTNQTRMPRNSLGEPCLPLSLVQMLPSHLRKPLLLASSFVACSGDNATDGEMPRTDKLTIPDIGSALPMPLRMRTSIDRPQYVYMRFSRKVSTEASLRSVAEIAKGLPTTGHVRGGTSSSLDGADSSLERAALLLISWLPSPDTVASVRLALASNAPGHAGKRMHLNRGEFEGKLILA